MSTHDQRDQYVLELAGLVLVRLPSEFLAPGEAAAYRANCGRALERASGKTREEDGTSRLGPDVLLPEATLLVVATVNAARDILLEAGLRKLWHRVSSRRRAGAGQAQPVPQAELDRAWAAAMESLVDKLGVPEETARVYADTFVETLSRPQGSKVQATTQATAQATAQVKAQATTKSTTQPTAQSQPELPTAQSEPELESKPESEPAPAPVPAPAPAPLPAEDALPDQAG